MSTELTTSPVPRKLNPGMIEALSLAIAKGNYAVTACNLCEIDESTFYDWLNLAKLDFEAGRESIYTSLAKSLKKADAKAENERVERIRDAGIGGQVTKRITRIKKDGTEEIEENFSIGQWLADITHLERWKPERWGRKDRTRVDINERKSVMITHVDVVLNQGTGQVIEGESRELTEGE